MPHTPLQTFIIYARADEAHKNELLRHLKGTLIASGDLRVWQDGNLLPGEDWEKSIKQNLKKADLVLVLVSSDSLGSDFINTPASAPPPESPTSLSGGASWVG